MSSAPLSASQSSPRSRGRSSLIRLRRFTRSKVGSERARALGIAVAVAVATLVVVAIKQQQSGVSSDFGMFWTAARVVAHGGDPYTAIQPGGPWKWDSGYLYPLPAAIVLIPLAWLPVTVAQAVFSATGMGALAYAIARSDGPHR